jgi:hypothetical protein
MSLKLQRDLRSKLVLLLKYFSILSCFHLYCGIFYFILKCIRKRSLSKVYDLSQGSVIFLHVFVKIFNIYMV